MKSLTLTLLAVLSILLVGCKEQESKEIAVIEAEQKASQIVANAKKESDAILKSAFDRADAAEQEYLKRKLAGLERYPADGARVDASLRYLKYFKRIGGEIVYNLSNNTTEKIAPSLKIIFYDQSGVTTGYASIVWLIDRVNPNSSIEEREKIVGQISPNPTKYYRVVFN